MIGWFTALALPQKLAAGGVLVIVFGLVAYVAINWADISLDRAEEKGAAVERADTLEAVLEKGVKANDAVNDLRSRPDLRHEQCLRYSDTPENC